MKADISLAERRRIESEQQAEIRAMLAPRHFATMQEQMAVDAALARLEVEHLTQAAPAIYAAIGRSHPAAPVSAPVVTPEPIVTVPASLPVEVSRSAPDGLRQRFGLR